MSNISIFSWNINGIRAVVKKGAFDDFFEQFHPDIVCFQEIKAQPGQAVVDLPDYAEFYNSAKRPGYSGTAIFSKTTPQNIIHNFPDHLAQSYPWHEDPYGDPLSEGRIITAEYPNFFLVNVYTPNSKHDLTRLPLRHQLWDPAFLRFLKELEKTKPLIVCGDFNAAHTEIDLARPKDNQHNAGFTPEERVGIQNYLAAGLIDTFRALHPNERRYTWWTWRANARARDIGWRIDYFFISKSLLPHLKSAEIHDHITGSDHCPISINLEF